MSELEEKEKKRGIKKIIRRQTMSSPWPWKLQTSDLLNASCADKIFDYINICNDHSYH